MSERRRFNPSGSFQDRLATFAEDARERAAKLPPGPERNVMKLKANQADSAADLDGWARELFSELVQR
jgi:hypothetical protein